MFLRTLKTVRNNWKKTLFFSGCIAYASKYVKRWIKEDQLMRDYCLKAREYGRQTITASERPRKMIIFLNPAARDGKTKYLLEKHVLPMLHLAGIEVHIVRTEHEGQAKSYMGVLDRNVVDAIVVAGGDGTLSEIVTGLLRRDDDIAQRMPIGVLPFGKTNTFSSRLFPPEELEVERYCKASMAIIANKQSFADVMEVMPQSDKSASDYTDTGGEAGPLKGDKKVYILSSLLWGVHSDVDTTKSKYWYFPGPLKRYYCYIKKILFGEWPPHVKASLELSPPCDGCCRCLTSPIVKAPVVKPAKSVWWWPTDNRIKKQPVKKDPRLQIENPACGVSHTREISTNQLQLISVKQITDSGDSCSLMELKLSPDLTKTELMSNQTMTDTDMECVPVSCVTINPHVSEPWYVMDSERFEVMPATIRILKDKIKVFTS